MLQEPLVTAIEQMGLTGAPPEVIAEMFDDDFAIEMLQMFEAEKDAERYEKFKHLFPDLDDCPLTSPEGFRYKQVGDFKFFARDYYQKHLEFFRQGASFRARCLMAANRCITPWTYLETPAGEVPSAEVWTSAKPDVLSWVGESRCVAQSEAGLLKSIEPAYRLVTEQGRFVDCTSAHRVLTDEGWLSLDQLVSLSSGLRWCQRAEDYQASCESDGYLGDRPLRSLAGIGLGRLPSQDDARTRNPMVFSLADEVVRTHQRSLSDPTFGHLSTHGDLKRLSDLFGHLSGPSSASPVLRLSERSRELQRLAAASFPPQEGGQFRRGGCEYLAPSSLQSECRDVSCRPIEPDERRRSHGQSLYVQSLGRSVRELDRDGSRIAIFYPAYHPPLVGGERIVAIVPLGLQPIIDAHVPPASNYLAGGMIHHNTGKTFSAGGYELACHLTGDYPDWWQGKLFRHPIRAWACGKTNETTRDIVQTTLLGDVEYRGQRKLVDGSGVIPRETIGLEAGQLTWKQGVADLVDTIRVRHKSGGWSKLGLKSYQQGRGSFEGTAQHVIWDDEEPPMDVYGEQIIRTATTKGILMLTFTPLEGMSDVVQQFLPSNGFET